MCSTFIHSVAFCLLDWYHPWPDFLHHIASIHHVLLPHPCLNSTDRTLHPLSPFLLCLDPNPSIGPISVCNLSVTPNHTSSSHFPISFRWHRSCFNYIQHNTFLRIHGLFFLTSMTFLFQSHRFSYNFYRFVLFHLSFIPFVILLSPCSLCLLCESTPLLFLSSLLRPSILFIQICAFLVLPNLYVIRPFPVIPFHFSFRPLLSMTS